MTLPKVILASTLTAVLSTATYAQEILTGDEGLACEAVLCLATGSPPSECTPALTRFYSISYPYWSDTLQGRIRFLNQCPSSSSTPAMRNLVNAMADGAGRCDAASLNATLLYTVSSPSGRNTIAHNYIGNAAPDYCATYTSHPYTDLSTLQPLYVGEPLRGGHWASPSTYSQELAAYQARIAVEDLASQQAAGDSN